MKNKSSLYNQSIICDLTLPWVPEAQNKDNILERYYKSKFGFVSLSVGVERMNTKQTIEYIKQVKKYIKKNKNYIFADNIATIRNAKNSHKLSLGFHFQGSEMLGGKVSNVKVFYDLGIRHMLLAKDYRSKAADGCFEPANAGLSIYGKALIKEMNNVGMIVDLTHTGYKSSIEAIELSTKPVIFSHSNPNKLKKTNRNISDEQIKKCSKTGGLIGIVGFGHFLKNNDISPENFVNNIQHIADLVGPKHIGLGLDYVYYQKQFLRQVKSNKFGLPKEYLNNMNGFIYFQPEKILDVTNILIKKNYSTKDIKGILGENFLRIAKKNWK